MFSTHHLVQTQKSRPLTPIEKWNSILCPMTYMWRCSVSLLSFSYHAPLVMMSLRDPAWETPPCLCRSFSGSCFRLPGSHRGVERLSGKLTVPKCWCLIRASESQPSQQRVTLSVLSHRPKMPFYSGDKRWIFLCNLQLHIGYSSWN